MYCVHLMIYARLLHVCQKLTAVKNDNLGKHFGFAFIFRAKFIKFDGKEERTAVVTFFRNRSF